MKYLNKISKPYRATNTRSKTSVNLDFKGSILNSNINLNDLMQAYEIIEYFTRLDQSLAIVKNKFNDRDFSNFKAGNKSLLTQHSHLFELFRTYIDLNNERDSKGECRINHFNNYSNRRKSGLVSIMEVQLFKNMIKNIRSFKNVIGLLSKEEMEMFEYQINIINT